MPSPIFKTNYNLSIMNHDMTITFQNHDFAHS